MWSLPDIAVRNARAAAAKDGVHKAVETGVDPETGKRAVCEREDADCGGEVRGVPYYDIFSDDPKGVLFLCKNHAGEHDDHLFDCDDCGRLMMDHITWEPYVQHTKDGDTICLNCFAQRVIDDPASWISLTKAGIDAIDFDRVRTAPHIIAVSGPTHGLICHGNVEFDSMSGECIGGDGVDGLKDALRQARKEGKRKALIVIDAIYQFAVSIGVYTL